MTTAPSDGGQVGRRYRNKVLSGTAVKTDEHGDPWPEPKTDGGGGGKLPAPVAAGAGWLLGLLAWGWVGLPFVKGGPAAVKDVWRAKFLNKARDGSELP